MNYSVAKDEERCTAINDNGTRCKHPIRLKKLCTKHYISRLYKPMKKNRTKNKKKNVWKTINDYQNLYITKSENN